MTTHDADQIRTAVRERYAAAARTASSCCGPSGCSSSDSFGMSQYDDEARSQLPAEALTASLGCGNPTILVDLRPGDVVLDLGSGGGIDAFLSARRVAPGGKVYGLDMTPDMLELAHANKDRAGIENVEFLLGSIEDIPLPDNSVDVIISNCVVNLSADKDQVFREAFRVLRPGGRIAISDVVLSEPLTADLAGVMALWTGCIAGALTQTECAAKMSAAGFQSIDIEPTRVFGRSDLADLAAGLSPEDLPSDLDLDRAVEGLDGVIRSAFIRGTKPGGPAGDRQSNLPAIHVYEPALCCNTGVCGPDVDQRLVEFSADLAHLTELGAAVTRHNLANDPTAFTSVETVRSFLQLAGSDGLPLTTVDGVTVLTGTYPTRDQLLRFAGLATDTEVVPAGATQLPVMQADCCGPAGDC